MSWREPVEDLMQRAASLGVETTYQGADGVWRQPSPEAVAKVVEVLWADHDPTGGRPSTALTPMPRSAALAGGVMLFCPTYALWSDTDRDPSMGRLHDLCRSARLHGVDVVSTLPLHAAFLGAFLDEPFDPSPYAPVSRLHWNEAYIEPARIPGAEPIAAEARPPGERVDWRELAVARRRQLVDAVDELDPTMAAALDSFCTAFPDVSAYARFRADREIRNGREGRAGPTRARSIRSYELGQWLMDQSLHRLANDPGSAGVGLDVPIGCHPSGFEIRANPELFAPGMHVGAPPDPFFDEGQNWGFPPPLPGAGRRSGHRLWRQVVERVGRHAAVLRIDHVMAVHRLWWIPDGHSAADGVYVRYPAHEILTVIAAAAAAAGTTVVGENLGTVPPEVDDALAATGTLGMYEEQFTMLAGEAPGEVPADAVAGVRTHDMDAFAVAATDPAARAYAAALGVDTDPGEDPGALLERVLVRLGASDAYLVAVDLDDLDGETRPHNVPGVHDPRGWSRRAPRPVDELLSAPGVVRRLDLLGAARAGVAT